VQCFVQVLASLDDKGRAVALASAATQPGSDLSLVVDEYTWQPAAVAAAAHSLKPGSPAAAAATGSAAAGAYTLKKTAVRLVDYLQELALRVAVVADVDGAAAGVTGTNSVNVSCRVRCLYCLLGFCLCLLNLVLVPV
jgi:hypothetical protein